VEKTLLLKICKLPKNIDEKLDKQVGETLFSIIIFHCIFAMWIFGNETYFNEAPDLFTTDIELTNPNDRLDMFAKFI